jgi:hypothetical protein
VERTVFTGFKRLNTLRLLSYVLILRDNFDFMDLLYIYVLASRTRISGKADSTHTGKQENINILI